MITALLAEPPEDGTYCARGNAPGYGRRPPRVTTRWSSCQGTLIALGMVTLPSGSTGSTRRYCVVVNDQITRRGLGLSPDERLCGSREINRW